LNSSARRKRQELAARQRQQQRDVTVVIVGDGSLAEPLRALARTLGIEAACVFTGHRTDIVHVLHGFDLFVQSSEYEGTPNCVLEAMAVGVPLVATTVGGTAELVHDHVHGLLVPPHDTQALAAAIGEALDDRQASALRASAARLRIEEELSFDARMRTVERIYRALVDGRSTAGAHPAVA
jgi:glycosyltransferase involved in cell wall biosynthesis